MTEKEKFINDIKEILNRKTFRDEKWLEAFAHDVWYVKDYLKGYFTAEAINQDKAKCFACAVINSEDRQDHYWGVALVNYNRKGGSTTDRGFYLNYCPECGRKIADMRGEE